MNIFLWRILVNIIPIFLKLQGASKIFHSETKSQEISIFSLAKDTYFDLHMYCLQVLKIVSAYYLFI